MKPGKLQRMIFLFRFQPSHVIATVHNSNVNMASGVSQNRSSNQKFWFWLLNLLLLYRISSCQEIIVSCLVVAQVEGPKELGIWKLPNAKDEGHKKWWEDWLGEITKTRKVIATLRDKQKTIKCLHARKTFILKISKHVSSKIKQIRVKYICNILRQASSRFSSVFLYLNYLDSSPVHSETMTKKQQRFGTLTL